MWKRKWAFATSWGTIELFNNLDEAYEWMEKNVHPPRNAIFAGTRMEWETPWQEAD